MNTAHPNPARLFHGAAWYPEQVSVDTRREDVRLMRQLGLNVARLGEFAWSSLEPMEGRYEFGWLVDALDLLHEHGLGAVVGTPSATPPQWLLSRHPEIGFVDYKGYRHGHGTRQHACYNQPIFRQHANRVAGEMARAVGAHPALVAWQLDNEVRGHQKLCICEACRAAWARTLEAEHGTIQALNAAWGTAVWSNTYEDFASVPPPYKVPCWSHHYSLLIAYRRFMSDSAVEFLHEQAAVVRAHSAAPITHNSENSVDEHALFAGLDFAGVDIYVDDPAGVCPAHWKIDSCRAVRPGRRFWTMETGSGDPFAAHSAVTAHWLRCFAFLHYASGAGGFLYWPWRQLRTGTEIGNLGVVYAGGQPGVGWDEIVLAEETRRALEPLLSEYKPVQARVALVRSERNGHFFFSDRVGGLEANFSYQDHLVEQHRTLVAVGAWRDVIFDEADPSGYHVIFSPYLPWASDGFRARMQAHLEHGGVWVVGPYCGYRDRDHTAPTEALLGAVETMLGVRTEQFCPGGGVGVTMADGAQATTSLYVSVFAEGIGDEVLGRYDGGPYAGRAWGLRHPHAGGVVYVLGSEIDPAAREKLYAAILRREGIVLHPQPARVWLCPQTGPGGEEAWALTNWDEVEHRVTLPRAGVERLGAARVAASIVLPPFTNAFVVLDK